MADNNQARRLFLGCFMAMIATAFGFAVRGGVLNEIGVQFQLTEEQKGILGGVGLFPFAISIILFSLIVDRIGYGVDDHLRLHLPPRLRDSYDLVQRF